MNEKEFPGVTKMADDLKNWYWIYGKTPKFTIRVEKEFTFGHLEFSAEVEEGSMTSCSIASEHSPPFLNNLKAALTGTLLWRSNILAQFQQYRASNDDEKAVAAWLLSWMLTFV